jgi:tripartite-type tricarboxylate transporter receptor subunit TctC
MILSTQVYNRPFALPPGVSDDKAKILQDAFKATVEDPAIMKKAENIGLQLQYLSAQQIDKLINLVFKAPAGRKTLAVQELKKAGLT